MIFLSIGALISSDILIAQLPQMATFYKTDAKLIQDSIGVYLLGLAFAQLLYGPLSDFYGRKKVLYVGLLLYLFSSFVLFITSSLEVLLYFRVAQGVGACAGMVISRAIISDRLDANGASTLYLMIFPFIGVSPALSPLLGELLSYAFGFKACFMFLLLFALASLLLCIFYLKESLDLSARTAFSIKALSLNIFYVIKTPAFVYFALIACFGYSEYFAYLVESSFLLEKLGMDAKNVWCAYALLSFCYITGNLLAKKLTPKIGVIPTLSIGIGLFVFGAAIFLAQFYVFYDSLFTTLFCMGFISCANGFLMPLSIAKGVSACEKYAGSASGVMGFLQLGSAGLTATFTGEITKGVSVNLGFFILFLALCVGLCYVCGYKRYAR